MQDRKRIRLGIVLLDWRHKNELNLTDAAEQIGIHRATLNRLERGENADARTLARILFWMIMEEI